MSLIADNTALAGLCGRLANEEFVTVDTEFMRESTYWPQLCVIQMAGDGEAAAVDALADGIDLTPVFELMRNPGVQKVFHAARQDLEIFYHLTGELPAPMFDTQVAAMVCGFGDSVGYETLVRKLAKAEIDKSSRFTDWARRPLTDKQINYALADVTHLRTVYRKLSDKLGDNGRREWLDEEIGTLTTHGTYVTEPDQAWKRVKSKSAKPRFLAILREVAGWRELEAQARDTPRNRVLRDEALVEIAHHAPRSPGDLARTRGLGKRMAEGGAGAAILEAVERGLAVPVEDCPRPEKKEPLPRGLGPVSDLMKVLLKMKCEEHHVAQRLVANSDDIERLAAFGDKADVPALAGWRRKIFGEDALALKRGDIAVLVAGRKLEIVELEPDAD